MIDKLNEKLDGKKKEQLLSRVQECCDKDVLTVGDWMKIYDVLLEACKRDSAATLEAYMVEKLKASAPEGEENE